VTIPNSVTSIGNHAFYGCSSLTSVTIPNSVTSIGEYAFRGCSGLTSVTIGNSVTSIGEWAFWGCIGLTSVTIPNSVTSIGSLAFYECSSLTSVHITDLAAWCKINFGDNPLCYAHHLYLNDEEIKDLIIPNSVTSIGKWAFADCSGLTSVTIPGSVTSIGKRAFSGCSGLTSVTIPGSVTSIGNYAFAGCSGLTSVTIPGSVTSIENYTFYGCSGLTSVTIPGSVTSIGGYAFYNCSGLTSVTIPGSVTSIGNKAFYGCSGLTSVTIPGGVTSIGWGAFYDCNLESVISLIEEPFAIYGKNGDWDRTFSLNTFNNATLYVPSGTIDKYKATEGWQDFANIVESDATAVTEVKAMPVLIQSEGSGLTIEGAEAGTPIRVYDLSGRLIGSTTAVEGATRVNVAAAAEKVVIVKVGERSVKVRR